MSNKRLYVAYGSNLNVGQMKYRCPDAKVFGTAEIKGYELLFKGSQTGSYLTIEKAKNGVVPVAVWEVSARDEINLDWYEGYPTFYYKQNMILDVKNKKTGKVSEQEVFVYIMHEDRRLGLPSNHYVEVCAEGYRDFGFDGKYLKDAVIKSADGIKNF